MLQLLQVLCSLCFVCAARSAASATDTCMANLDLDIVGNDIGDRHGVDSAAACCSVCQEMNGCVAAVHNSEDAVCYFKGAYDPIHAAQGGTTLVVVDPPPLVEAIFVLAHVALLQKGEDAIMDALSADLGIKHPREVFKGMVSGNEHQLGRILACATMDPDSFEFTRLCSVAAAKEGEESEEEAPVIAPTSNRVVDVDSDLPGTVDQVVHGFMSARAAATCNVRRGTEMVGLDLEGHGGGVWARAAEECCTPCASLSGCVAAVWRASHQRCYFKGELGAAVEGMGEDFALVTVRDTGSIPEQEAQQDSTGGRVVEQMVARSEALFRVDAEDEDQEFLNLTGELDVDTTSRSDDSDRVCFVRRGFEIVGNDLVSDASEMVATPEECCAACRRREGCVASVYRYETTTCWFKKSAVPATVTSDDHALSMYS